MLTIAYPQNLIFKMPLLAEYDYYIAPSSDRKKNKEHGQNERYKFPIYK